MPNRRQVVYWETPRDTGSGEPAPGTGEELEAVADPTSAETQNTGDQHTPQAVPYSRFKEVNDARRAAEERLSTYRDLEAQGYGPEELQRLAGFEMEFTEKPTEVIANLIGMDDINLTPEVKQRIHEALSLTDDVPPAKVAEADPVISSGNGDGTPAGISLDELPEEVRSIVADHQARQAAESNKAVSDLFDRMLEVWDEADKEHGITTPQGTKLAWLGVAAQGETDPVAIITQAREGYLADRAELSQSILDSARTTGGTGPKPVPGGGSGAATPTPPARPRSLHEATKMATAAAERGTLVPEE